MRYASRAKSDRQKGERISLWGVHVGTTGAKASAFDVVGRILGQAYQEYAWLHLGGGKGGDAAGGGLGAITTVIRAAARQAGESDPVKAIGISSMGEGAAILAGVGAEEYSSTDEGVRQVVKIREVYQPRPELTKEYEQRFETYRRIYPALAPLAHQL